jgi:hypothetical protein
MVYKLLQAPSRRLVIIIEAIWSSEARTIQTLTLKNTTSKSHAKSNPATFHHSIRRPSRQWPNTTPNNKATPPKAPHRISSSSPRPTPQSPATQPHHKHPTAAASVALPIPQRRPTPPLLVMAALDPRLRALVDGWGNRAA